LERTWKEGAQTGICLARLRDTTETLSQESKWDLIHAGYFLCLLYEHEGGGEMFLWNVCCFSTYYTALYTNRYNSSVIAMFIDCRWKSIVSYFFLLPPLSLPVTPIWSIGHPWKALFPLSFLILTQSVWLIGREISLSPGRYLHKKSKRRKTSMPRVGFEPTIPASERAKTVHALDCAAIAIGVSYLKAQKLKYDMKVYISTGCFAWMWNLASRRMERKRREFWPKTEETTGSSRKQRWGDL
jgi:hypothetical protein